MFVFTSNKIHRHCYIETFANNKYNANIQKEQCMLYKRTLNKPNNPKLWEQAKTEAKKRFKVFPSAYANVWANRWYKEHGGDWSKSDTDSRFTEPKKTNSTLDTKMTNRTPLEPFEQYVDDDESSDDDKTEKANDAQTEKSGKKEIHHWVREPWVDISRPVIDEAGNVIGFHQVGSNTKDINTARDGYRTSYPKIMPRSKALRLNAIEREELIRRTNNRFAAEQENGADVENNENDEET